MNATNQCMCMRHYLDSFIEKHPLFKYSNYEIAPLCEFAKFGNHLARFAIVRNIITDKLQLWYHDIDSHFLRDPHLPLTNSYLQTHNEFVEYAFHAHSIKQIVPFEFDDINILLELEGLDSYSYMAFLITENAKTGMSLYNDGEINVTKWYDSIDIIGIDYFLAREHNESFILDKMGDVVCTLGQYRFKRLIGEDAYLAEFDDGQLIRKFNGKVIAPIVVGNFKRLTDEYHYLTHDSNGYSILDFYGNVITGGYDIIKNSNDKYILAEKSEEFYLLDLSGLVVLKSKDFMTVTRALWKR